MIAVARSSVFDAWRVQKPGWATRRRRRSLSDMLGASSVVCNAASHPLAALSPPTLRIRSEKTGSNSTQCPSPSMTGWLRFARICVGVWWPLPLMCLPPTTTGSSSHRLLGSRRAPCREIITRLDFAPSPGFGDSRRTVKTLHLQPERVLIELDDSAGPHALREDLGGSAMRAAPDVS